MPPFAVCVLIIPSAIGTKSGNLALDDSCCDTLWHHRGIDVVAVVVDVVVCWWCLSVLPSWVVLTILRPVTP